MKTFAIVDNMITHIPEGNEAVLALKTGSGLIAKNTEQEVLDEIERLKLIYNPIQSLFVNENFKHYL